jgi:hypothetical protein
MSAPKMAEQSADRDVADSDLARLSTDVHALLTEADRVGSELVAVVHQGAESGGIRPSLDRATELRGIIGTLRGLAMERLELAARAHDRLRERTPSLSTFPERSEHPESWLGAVDRRLEHERLQAEQADQARKLAAKEARERKERDREEAEARRAESERKAAAEKARAARVEAEVARSARANKAIAARVTEELDRLAESHRARTRL